MIIYISAGIEYNTELSFEEQTIAFKVHAETYFKAFNYSDMSNLVGKICTWVYVDEFDIQYKVIRYYINSRTYAVKKIEFKTEKI